MGLLLLGAIGCHQGMHSAAKLPAQYVVAPQPRINRLDLSQIAQKSTRSEVIQPGDFLKVFIGTGFEEKRPEPVSLRVGDDGQVNVPLVGPVLVAGLEPRQADESIRQASIQRNIYRNPQIAVEVFERQTNRVTVTGAVNKPGVYQLPTAESDLLAALVAAEGLADDAESVVEIRHPPSSAFASRNSPGEVAQVGYNGPRGNAPVGGSRIQQVDLEEAVRNGRSGFPVEDSTVIHVARRPEQKVYVMGLVKKADHFEMPPDGELRLLDALALAGGRTLEIADSVKIVRNLPGSEKPVVITASVRDAKKTGAANIQLAAGDVVTVEETPLTFTYDFLRNFARIGLSGAAVGL
ncbi:Polysaccharide biosynthesis/export protein [Lignipirellula cremea]|uniref:Polysaccharide biosynthesis/export protein n=2 Tax=Lignipirellula cremea TaxID=2528010 RepID=A0A518DZE6_9BACT|nr:Polysaccharide biosynthesis/export protein [Lignipirellula cremea]